jgi:hypothetical protein
VIKLLDILKEQGYWSSGADKVASEKQKCGLSGQDGGNSREMRQQDRESARADKMASKEANSDLKKTFSMSYNRNNEPLDKTTRRQVYDSYKQFDQSLLNGGSYSPEQKFAVLYKVYDWAHNVPTISYTKKLSTKFNNPNIKTITLQDLAGYANQMGWDNFVNWYNNGGPDIK